MYLPRRMIALKIVRFDLDVKLALPLFNGSYASFARYLFNKCRDEWKLIAKQGDTVVLTEKGEKVYKNDIRMKTAYMKARKQSLRNN